MAYEARLTDKQKIALKALSPKSAKTHILYGGAAGGGKSWLGCYWHIMRRLKYAGTCGLIARSELKELKLTTMVTFFSLCNEMGLKAGDVYKYDQQMSTIKWFNGSTSILMEVEHRPSDPDYNYLGSYEAADAFVDEAASVPGKGIEILSSRVRKDLIGGVPKVLLTCNPSKGWLYNNFYIPSNNGRLDPDYEFIPALLSDNTEMKNRAAYEKMLNKLSERDKKRLLLGIWEYDDSPDLLFETDAMAQMFIPFDEKFVGKPYITCDPAALGKDRTIIGIWKGLMLIKVIELTKQYPHEVAAKIRELAQAYGVPLSDVVVDSDGLGIGIQGLLKCRAFNNGSSAIDKEHFTNLKSECYFKLADYVKSNKIFITDHSQREQITKELDLVRDRTKEDKKRAVSTKDEIKASLGYSPDYADMLMMRMYFELRPNYGKYSV